MDGDKLARLLARLESGAHETAAGFRTGMVLVAGLFATFTVVCAAQGTWAVAAFMLAFTGAIIWIGRKATERNRPEKMLPVVGTLREHPEQVTLIRHYQTSDTRRMFVTDWIEVRTPTHRLLVKAKTDWELLQTWLHERCPQAQMLDR